MDGGAAAGAGAATIGLLLGALLLVLVMGYAALTPPGAGPPAGISLPPAVERTTDHPLSSSATRRRPRSRRSGRAGAPRRAAGKRRPGGCRLSADEARWVTRLRLESEGLRLELAGLREAFECFRDQARRRG